jgi:hypothetical protein
VDTNVVGTYIIRYNATDSSGNAAVEVTRVVNVEQNNLDEGLPSISLNGKRVVTLKIGEHYSEEGAEAWNSEGPLPVIISGSVDILKMGKYFIQYMAIDKLGNRSDTLTRKINVTPPAK